MKTTIAAFALVLGLAGAASAKLDIRFCQAGTPQSKNAQACEGTPFADALIAARTTLCLFEHPETGEMDAFLKGKVGTGKFVMESARKAYVKLDIACLKLKEKKR